MVVNILKYFLCGLKNFSDLVGSALGKERKGKERKGKERKVKRKEEEGKGRERKGKERKAVNSLLAAN